LVIDSKISFDVDNFFSLDQYTLIGFLILCFLVLAFSRLSKILLRPAIETNIAIPQAMLSIALTGLLWVGLFRQQVALDILITVWMIGYTGMFYLYKQDLYTTLPKSPNFILRVLVFAASVAGIVMYQNREVEFAQRKQNAYRLSIQSDPSGEHLLSLAAANFDTAFLRDQFYRFTTEYSSRYLKDSLTAENFSGYLNKYDSRIYVFDSLYRPLFNDDSTAYSELKSLLLNQARKTDIAHLYVFNRDNRQHFIYAQTISSINGRGQQGYLFVLVNPKRYKSEALYPELFTQAQNLAADLNTSDAYAVYSNGRLLNHFGDYAFPSEIPAKQWAYYEYKEVVNGSYNELWYNAGNQKQVIIVKKREWLIEFFTLIAYIFCSFLFIMFLFRAGGFLLQKRLNLKPRELLNQLTIRTQVHTTIIFLSIFSFIIIGIVTISFFIIRFNQGNQDRLSRAIQVMSNEIANNVEAQLQFDDVITLNDQGVNTALEKAIAEISDIHNVEVNFFDTTGSLKISTQPYVYNKHLLNEKMDPRAYMQLHDVKQIRFVQEEQVGGFSYLSIYVPVNDPSGKPYAYLNIPYFNSQSELKQEISGFLATLINLNAFIFLIAGSLAFFLTNRITASFQFIANKMRAIALGRDNEAIVWNRQDEIGLLVNEYNRMLGKLEESATALARNEREGAWREMARQVAHEIKNPLTPMKLSIQYLKQAIDSKSPNVQELSERVTQTLVDQIDQLSRIAGDFSQFANIGNSVPELVQVDAAVEATLQLYRTNQKLSIRVNTQESGMDVLIDKLQFNRMLTNLLQNVVEAGEKQEQISIEITLSKVQQWAYITIADDCGGIPASLRQKIFTPNFTTKTSGTGLGLAICRGIAEQAGGTIILKYSDNAGSAFQIQLPLAAH
jgi:signal transduction histidine kinase